MDKALRQHKTQVKLNKRKQMMKDYGLQGGCVYDKHRKKISNSLNYMRDGNVSHYVSVGFGKKTKNSRQFRTYGPRLNPSARDAKQLYSIDEQLRAIDLCVRDLEGDNCE